MKLRKPCEHGRYEEHVNIPERDPTDPIGTIRGPFFPCPGGVFLPDDALVIKLCEHGLFDRHSLDLETLDYQEIFCPGGEKL